MATVKLRFSALPAHVRTARLVAAAVARRAGVDESVLDEVRLAVGEACSRAVGLHRRNRPDEPVMVTLIHDGGRFSIEVSDSVPAPVAPVIAGLGEVGVVGGIPVAAGRDSGNSAGPLATGPDAGVPGQTTALPGAEPGIAASAGGPALNQATDTDHLTEESTEALSGSMGLAVISGLVDDLDVRASGDGAVIRMTWPAAGNGQGAAAN
jgi:hypothetical protein